MILNSYLTKKLLEASFLSVSVIFTIFFIFSLLGNLGENFNFSKIIFLSLLTTIQILFYIPIFIFFLIVATFSIILKSHNEIIITAHYLSKKKIILVFSAYVLLFLFFEFNKGLITQKIEDLKLQFIDSDKYLNSQVIIFNNADQRNYSIIKNVRNSEKEISVFSLVGDSFYEALYTDRAKINNHQLVTDDYYRLYIDKINKNKNNLIIIKNLSDYSDNRKINYIESKEFSILDQNEIFSLLNIFLVILAILIISIDKNLFNKNNSKLKYYLVGTLLIFYLYLVNNIKLSILHNEFQYLSLFLISIYLLKKIIYEKTY